MRHDQPRIKATIQPQHGLVGRGGLGRAAPGHAGQGIGHVRLGKVGIGDERLPRHQPDGPWRDQA